jgi:hypothetical protein
MHETQETTALPQLGSVVMRTEKTGVRLISDAVAVLDMGRTDTVLMVSAAGPESSVKAVAAGLRSNTRADFVIDHPGVYCHRPVRHDGGYKVMTSRLDGNYWHMLIFADVPGFLPILDDASLWQELKTERFTTPLVRSWIPWLRKRMEEERLLARIRQSGCNAGLLMATTEQLDELVTQGLETGEISIPSMPTQDVPELAVGVT